MKRNRHAVTVRGAGWLDGGTWGCVARRERVAYGTAGSPAPWKIAATMGGPVKNAGRFDEATRMTLSACALALRDAGLGATDGSDRPLALIGTNEAGCVEANRIYYRDYLDAGRKLARGNLFIYTLPSSPLAETSIHFRLTGPMLYIGYSGGGLAALMEEGALLIADEAAAGVLAVRADARAGVAVLIERAAPDEAANGEAVREACEAAKDAPAGELAERLEMAMKKDGSA